MTQIYPRHNRALVVEGLADTRIVFLVGARQVGKTTLARGIATAEYPLTVFSLDDDVTRNAARDDPTAFVAGLPRPALLDEIQRAPNLLLALKKAVDHDQSPGQFLITGSANILTSKKVKDALTGRIDTVSLWPLSQAEVAGTANNFVDTLLAGSPPQVVGASVGRDAFVSVVAAGGYPEARRRAPARRDRWFRNYLDSTLDRDLRDVSEALKLEEMPRLLRLLATQAASVVSYRSIGERLDLHHDTVKSYIGILEQMFLVRRLPAWRPGLGAREIAKPKIYIADSGLLCHLVGADEKRLAEDDQVTGKALENFVAMEVVKHLEWASRRVRLYHYQREREDIDLVIEDADGSLAAVEVKALATVRDRDMRWLARLREQRSDRFRTGVVLYSGEQTVPLGDRLWAVPVSGLWA